MHFPQLTNNHARGDGAHWEVKRQSFQSSPRGLNEKCIHCHSHFRKVVRCSCSRNIWGSWTVDWTSLCCESGLDDDSEHWPVGMESSLQFSFQWVEEVGVQRPAWTWEIVYRCGSGECHQWARLVLFFVDAFCAGAKPNGWPGFKTGKIVEKHLLNAIGTLLLASRTLCLVYRQEAGRQKGMRLRGRGKLNSGCAASTKTQPFRSLVYSRSL